MVRLQYNHFKFNQIVTIMELTGMIIAVLPAASGVSARTGNSWMKQDYVIEVPGQYPKKCCFNIFGEDRIKQFNIQGGETVTIQFDIDAHEYNGRWFNEIRCYNVLRAQAPQTASPQPTQQAPQQQAVQAPLFDNAEQSQGTGADDLPF